LYGRIRAARLCMIGAPEASRAGQRRPRSCRASMVLVDQPTEHRPAPNIARTNRHSPNRWPVRDCERQAPVRPLVVVMVRVGPQDPFEVAATKHQDVVEALRDR